MKTKFEIYCDGGCSANGSKEQSGYGSFAIFREKGEYKKYYHSDIIYFGSVTNNGAEYLAMINAISKFIKIVESESVDSIERITINSDSKLVISQVTGKWKIQEESLIPLHKMVVKRLNKLKTMGVKVFLRHVPREQNVKILGH